MSDSEVDEHEVSVTMPEDGSGAGAGDGGDASASAAVDSGATAPLSDDEDYQATPEAAEQAALPSTFDDDDDGGDIRVVQPGASSNKYTTSLVLIGSMFFTAIVVGMAIALTTRASPAPMPSLPSGGQYDDTSLSFMQRAKALHAAFPMIDGHNDLPWEYRVAHKDQVWTLDTFDLRTDLKAFLMTDIPRLRAGGVGGQFWSVYVSCTMQGNEAVRATLEQIDLVHKMVERYSDTFSLALSGNDIRAAFAQGKIASMIGIEGGHQIDSSLASLRMMHRLGARYMTLTHTCNTPWADSCAQVAQHDGLSEFGRTVVKEMNRIGMFVDLSHVSAETMHDALDTTVAPVIFSHSSARAICSNARNVPDDVLSRLPANGGVVMVNFFPAFVSCNHTATLSEVADHVDHIVQVAGVNHVGYGADFDGIPTVPQGLEDVSTFPALTAELYRRGYSSSDLRKIIGGNLLRAFDEMLAVAARTHLDPYEQTINI